MYLLGQEKIHVPLNFDYELHGVLSNKSLLPLIYGTEYVKEVAKNEDRTDN